MIEAGATRHRVFVPIDRVWQLGGDVTAFIARPTEPRDSEAYVCWPGEPLVRQRFAAFLRRFGLLERLKLKPCPINGVWSAPISFRGSGGSLGMEIGNWRRR